METPERWVGGLNGRLIVHLPAGALASDTWVEVEPLASCADAPEGFSLGQTCFSVTAGSALLKSIDVCVRYTDADLDTAEGDPRELRLAVYDEIEGD